MAAKENAITAADTCAALDQEFVKSFSEDFEFLQSHDNVAGYLKGLIRQDMERVRSGRH